MNLMNELDDSYPQAIYRLLVDGVAVSYTHLTLPTNREV